MIYHITIPGRVKAKERPRKGRYGNFYTPPATQNYEANIHRCASQSGLKPFDKDIDIGIGICFYGKYGRCDIDNLCKSVLDGFKYFFNDNRVIQLVAKKILSKETYTKVIIW